MYEAGTMVDPSAWGDMSVRPQTLIRVSGYHGPVVTESSGGDDLEGLRVGGAKTSYR